MSVNKCIFFFKYFNLSLPIYCRYLYSEKIQPIDVESYCDGYSGYHNYWDFYGNFPRFIKRYEEAIYGRNSSHFEHCKYNTRQNVAIVHVQIASSVNDLINKITKTPKATTADILSNIGK